MASATTMEPASTETSTHAGETSAGAHGQRSGSRH